MTLDLPTILERYGLPIAGLAVVIFFVWRGLWPLLIKYLEGTQKILQDQLTAAQDERRQSMKEFSAAIERRDQLAAQAATQHAAALNAMTDELKRFRQEREGTRRVRKP